MKLLPLIPKTCQPSCASNDLALTRPKLELLTGTADQYQARINQLADTFLAARDSDRLVGFIVGPVVDARFKYIEDWMDV